MKYSNSRIALLLYYLNCTSIF